jgi:Carboxypeptidase regulatory-like domain
MRSFRQLHRILFLLVFSLVTFLPLGAQVDQGRITGVVRDPSKAAIGGATVAITNDRTGEQRTTNTNDQGYYSFLALQPSLYTVKVSAAQFAPAEAKQLRVTVGQEVHQDFDLAVQSQSESVLVEAASVQVDTSSARIGINVNPREVNQLPINGRQLSQLALQAPGAVNAGSGTFNDLRFSGRSNEQNAVRYDGVEGSAVIDSNPGNLNGEIPSPFKLQASLENVQEFRVDSNNFPAEYGTGTGGQISVITKSGSNRFHGAAFEYLRNDKLDARNFFDLPGQKSKLRLNQFGGSIGGPLIKDKFFFFGSFEGYRLRAGVNAVEAVPKLTLSAVPATAPLLPLFRAPGAVVIPGATNDPQTDIVQLNANSNVDENSGSLRLDYKVNDRHSLYARYFRDQAKNTQPEGVTGRTQLLRSVPQNAILSLVSVLGPNLINDAKFGYNSALTRVQGIFPVRNGIDLSQVAINLTGSVANNGIAGQSASSGFAVAGGLLRQNSASNGRASPYTPYSYSILDGLSWQSGQHSLKFGGEVRLLRLYTDRLGGTTYTFSNINGLLNNTPQSVQYLADVSAPSPFNNGATGTRLGKQEYYIGYVQDEWRVLPTLTLNLGLRYEYYTPMREDRNLDVIFNPVTGVIESPSRDFYHSSKNNFGPRVSFAWSPNFTGQPGHTVLRGGFGLYYGPGQTEDLIQPIESDRISSTLTSGVAFPLNTATLAANFLNNPQNRQFQPRAYDPAYKVPERIAQYTLSLQQELPGKMTATVGYVGALGRNLFLRNWTNRIVNVRTTQSTNAQGQTTASALVIRQFDIDNGGSNVLRPFAEIDFKTSGGTSDYNALQTQIVRRSDRGLTIAAQYTWAHDLGTSGGSNEALTSGNPFDYNYDYGNNNFDVRHTFNLSFLYELPFGRGKQFGSSLNGFAQTVLGNWQVGSIINARSGLPVNLLVTRPDTVFVNAAGNIVANGNCASATTCPTAIINTLGGGSSRNVRRPNVVPGVDPFLHSGGLAFLNPAAFSIPAPGTFGNLRRNQFHGPNFLQADMTIAKYFPVSESANLEFRTEIFNLPNRTNFALPNSVLPNALGTTAGTQVQPNQPFTTAAAGAFGKFNSTVSRTVGLGTNRQIQFALRLNF